jgi:uroporphyrinogen-III synthase
MRLLITRPREDADALAEILRARGHVPVVAPVMELRTMAGPPLPLENVQAVIATSANGVRALRGRTSKRDLPLYAVGPQTAEAAREAGFAPVVSADGDSSALVELVAGQADPAKGTLLHAAGAETAGRLRQALQAKGFTVETVVLYEAAPVASLPPEADSALRAGLADGVLLFSPRSAKTFATLVSEAHLEGTIASLEAYCISAATAAALAPLTFARMAVAGEPNQSAMLALIPAPAPAP